MPIVQITLEAARVNSGLNQKDAAEKLGVDVDTLRSWEKGKTFPNVPQIKRIEDTYGIPYAGIKFLVESSV